ncbi:MAG TPA: 50S ribosomal protein L29 [Candidatus Nanoarchaeia archaeon]|nr:50S ribosomal protein L29 [Candidatus Nanoarchaeia archaeon]
MVKIKEIRQSSKKELEGRVAELCSELMRLRSGARTGASAKNTKGIRTARRAIAKMMTILKEMEVAKQG